MTAAAARAPRLDCSVHNGVVDMPDQRRNHPLRSLANRLIDALGVRDAVDGAIKAANESGLPQGVGGPADAYRHLLIAGELRRRFGPVVGASLTSALVARPGTDAWAAVPEVRTLKRNVPFSATQTPYRRRSP